MKRQKQNDSAASAPPAPEREKKRTGEIEREIGGRKGPEPTRYGDWENGGKCVDF